MREIIININKKIEKIGVSLVFASKNPKTNQYNVNISCQENDKKRHIRIFCQEEEVNDLAIGIREGKITDLREYLTQEVDI